MHGLLDLVALASVRLAGVAPAFTLYRCLHMGGRVSEPSGCDDQGGAGDQTAIAGHCCERVERSQH